MANRLCYPMFDPDQKEVVRIKVPTGITLYPGDIVLANTLDTDDSDNIEVYTATPLGAVATDKPCIIINQEFEKYDSRRIQGNPDYTTYEFTAGMILNTIRLNKGQAYQISNDCLDNDDVVVPAVGVKLVPQVGDYQLATAASGGSSITVLNIDTTNSVGNGGLMGMDYISTNIARVE